MVWPDAQHKRSYLGQTLRKWDCSVLCHPKEIFLSVVLHRSMMVLTRTSNPCRVQPRNGLFDDHLHIFESTLLIPILRWLATWLKLARLTTRILTNHGLNPCDKALTKLVAISRSVTDKPLHPCLALTPACCDTWGGYVNLV